MADNNKAEEVDTGSHPLQDTWVLYELRERQGKEEYFHRHFPLFEFSTVEEFWAHWLHIPKPSEVFKDGGSDSAVAIKRADPENGGDRVSAVEAYVLFKKGLRPDTDFQTPDGEHATKFELRWRAARSRRFAEFDKAWEVVVLGIIGQCFGSNNTINGARFVDKSSRGTPMCRLEVWMSSEDFGDDVAAATKKAIELETQPKGGAQPARGAYGSGGLSPSWQKKRHNGSRY